MFEVYLEDAGAFVELAEAQSDDLLAKRYYRASVILTVSAVEAFINYIGDMFSHGEAHPLHEVAFLTDRKFGPKHGEFTILDQPEYQRLNDKLRFLFQKYAPAFDMAKEPAWSEFQVFKKFRDSIVHPHHEEESATRADYKDQIGRGLGATAKLIDALCRGIIGKPMRTRLKDFVP